MSEQQLKLLKLNRKLNAIEDKAREYALIDVLLGPRGEDGYSWFIVGQSDNDFDTGEMLVQLKNIDRVFSDTYSSQLKFTEVVEDALRYLDEGINWALDGSYLKIGKGAPVEDAEILKQYRMILEEHGLLEYVELVELETEHTSSTVYRMLDNVNGEKKPSECSYTYRVVYNREGDETTTISGIADPQNPLTDLVSATVLEILAEKAMREEKAA